MTFVFSQKLFFFSFFFSFFRKTQVSIYQLLSPHAAAFIISHHFPLLSRLSQLYRRKGAASPWAVLASTEAK